MLERAYTELIAPYFPYEDRDDLSTIQEFMSRPPGSQAEQFSYRGTVILNGSDLAAVTLYCVVKSGELSFMIGQYTVTSPDYRIRGLASFLATLREKRSQLIASEWAPTGLDFSVITVRDENNSTLWGRLGYRRIHFRFIQLPLHPGLPPSSSAHLRFKGHNERFRDCTELFPCQMRTVLESCNRLRSTDSTGPSFHEYSETIEGLYRVNSVQICRRS